MRLTVLQLGGVGEIDVSDDLPLLHELDRVARVPGTVMRMSDTRPLDLWCSAPELGLSDGDTIFLGDAQRGAAGALPLNALYRHNSELRQYLRSEHSGLFAAVLCTPADDRVFSFLNRHLAYELPALSGDCVVFAPVANTFSTNSSSFLTWWDREYQSLTFRDALKRIAELAYFYEPKDTYALAARLGINQSELPAVTFFDQHPTDNVTVRLDADSSNGVLLHALRELFSIAAQVCASPAGTRLQRLRDHLAERENRARAAGLSFSLISLRILSPTVASFSLRSVVAGLVSEAADE